MKSRRIILRNACFTLDMLKKGILYRCEKIGKRKLAEQDFWHGAFVWIREQQEDISNVGKLPANGLAAVIQEKLFPVVAFDNTYKFLEAPKGTTVTANICRHRPINYLKTF